MGLQASKAILESIAGPHLLSLRMTAMMSPICFLQKEPRVLQFPNLTKLELGDPTFTSSDEHFWKDNELIKSGLFNTLKASALYLWTVG